MNNVEDKSSEKRNPDSVSDPVNHPRHYERLRVCLEPVDICELYDFNIGNAIKYLLRAGRKDGAPELTDLKKALWYLERDWAYVCQNSEMHEPDFHGMPSARGVAAILLYAVRNQVLTELFLGGCKDVDAVVFRPGCYTRDSLGRAIQVLRDRIRCLEEKK